MSVLFGDQIVLNPANGNPYGSVPGGMVLRPPGRFAIYYSGTVYPLFGPNAVRDPLAAPALGRGIRRLAFNPSGSLLFASADGDGDATQASIVTLSLADPNTPSVAATLLTTFLPFALAAHPNGRYLYATAQGTALGYMFSYDAAGRLSALAGASFAAPPNARAALLSSDGSRLYLASYDTGRVQCYVIGSDGVPIARGDPVVSGIRPVGMTFDPDGKFVYVLNRGEDGATSSVTGYLAGADCGLTAVSAAPVPAGSMATAITSARFTP